MRHMHVRVAGVHHHREALGRALECGNRIPILTPEPTNEYDKNAVKVMLNGEHVGYIPRDDSEMVTRLLNLSRIQGIQAEASLAGKRSGKPWVKLTIEHRPLRLGKRKSAAVAAGFTKSILAADDFVDLSLVGQAIHAAKVNGDLQMTDVAALRGVYEDRVRTLKGGTK